MKYRKNVLKSSKLNKRLADEDLRLLQKMSTGFSVYKGLKNIYVRKPKHYKSMYSY